jgi:amidohydrolase
MDIKNKIIKYTEDNFENIRSLRRYFHMHPEVSKNEYNTAKKIEDELSLMGLKAFRVGETGVYTKIEGALPGKTIILRADIDALPILEEHECEYKSKNIGVMHACGHDAHTASLIYALKFINEYKSSLKGTVVACFQMAEEIGYGANIFKENGLLKGDRSFGLHIASNLPVGKIALVKGVNNASVDWFKIKVHGVESHIASPEKGVDALYVASLIVTSIQGLVTRMTSPLDSVLIGIGKLSAGSAYNIVAKEATMEGSLRAIDNTVRINTINKIKELSANIASIYGATVEVEFKCFTLPLVNDEEATLEAINVANEMFGESNVITSRAPSLSGDDFSVFIEEVKGAYAYIGTANPTIKETNLPHHNSHLDIDEDCLKLAVEMLISYTFWYLN